MGLFDFLRNGSGPELKDDGPSPDYAFVHYALKQIALTAPLQFLAISASPDAERFMDSILQDVGERCGRPATYDASSIHIHRTRINDFPCAIVELPEPKELAEAHLVAIVALVDTSSGPPLDMDQVESRYFTLEKGFSMSSEPRTVLAEWTAESHLNYGDGPEPTVQEFVAVLSEHI